MCTRPFTQCARLQCMYTPTIGAHLGSLCMSALPHFGLGILAIPCNTVRGYVCETSRNPATTGEYIASTYAQRMPRRIASTHPRRLYAYHGWSQPRVGLDASTHSLAGSLDAASTVASTQPRCLDARAQGPTVCCIVADLSAVRSPVNASSGCVPGRF